MKTVEMRYGVTFGNVILLVGLIMNLTDEEEITYDHAVENKISLSDVPELEAVLARAYEEIEEMEIQKGGHRYASWII